MYIILFAVFLENNNFSRCYFLAMICRYNSYMIVYNNYVHAEYFCGTV